MLLLFTFKQSLHSMLSSLLSLHGFNGLSLACSGSNCFGQVHDFSIRDKVLKKLRPMMGHGDAVSPEVGEGYSSFLARLERPQETISFCKGPQ